MMTTTKCFLQTNALDREAVRREVFYQARDLHFPNTGRTSARPGGSSAPAAGLRANSAPASPREAVILQANTELAQAVEQGQLILCSQRWYINGALISAGMRRLDSVEEVRFSDDDNAPRKEALRRRQSRTQPNSTPQMTPVQIDAEWQANSQLRDEFRGDKEAYLAYKRAEEMGLIRICGKQPAA